MGNAAGGHHPGQITLASLLGSELQLHGCTGEIDRKRQSHGHVLGGLEAEHIESATETTPEKARNFSAQETSQQHCGPLAPILQGFLAIEVGQQIGLSG
jgi:hypothetical protein